jgi:DNA-binding winged helix-turn-helix (wHTH) protein/tetratricopeptide (TPR) repeat protein
MRETPGNKEFIYEFGKFVLDPQERVLLSAGRPVHLADKVFDTLLLLVRHHGRLLTKDEMMTALWSESFVEESNLAKNISRLRKVLNTDGAELIETLPKHGYRFQGDVRAIDGATNVLVHRRLHVKLTQTIEEGGGRDFQTPSPAEIRSIAVLPFQPLGFKAEDDFFGLGITDALITQISRAGQITVRPTSSIIKYDAAEQNALAAARQLQVDAVLEGRFQRRGNQLRLTVQLFRTAGAALWADSFNTEIQDIFTVQDQIAERVVGALTKKLTGEAQSNLRKRDTENVEAYQEYLRGRYFWSKRTTNGYRVALDFFQRAIDIDPLYALAYAGMADIYNLLPLYDGFTPHSCFPKAKAAALKALSIDANLAEAHAALGLAMLHYDWNWPGAETAFQKAIDLSPGYAAAYQLLGVYLLRVDRLGEAIMALKKAQELDPLAPINTVWLAEVLRHHGDTAASIGLHQETLESAPDFFLAHYHLAFSYIDAGRLDLAGHHCQKAVSLSERNSLTLSLQGILEVARGDRGAVRATTDELLRMKAEKYISSANIASVYAAAGDAEKALEWLEQAVSERDPNLTWISFDGEFEFLKESARFQAILEKFGPVDQRVKAIMTPKSGNVGRSRRAAVLVLMLIALAALGFYLWNRPLRSLLLPDRTQQSPLEERL